MVPAHLSGEGGLHPALLGVWPLSVRGGLGHGPLFFYLKFCLFPSGICSPDGLSVPRPWQVEVEGPLALAPPPPTRAPGHPCLCWRNVPPALVPSVCAAGLSGFCTCWSVLSRDSPAPGQWWASDPSLPPPTLGQGSPSSLARTRGGGGLGTTHPTSCGGEMGRRGLSACLEPLACTHLPALTPAGHACARVCAHLRQVVGSCSA